MTDSSFTAFGCSFPPFSKEIPDAELWLPSTKQATVDALCEALRERQSALLIGEPGVGKTCVLRALRLRLGNEGFRLTYCHNATLGRRDFYRQLCQAIGLAPKATAASLFYALSTHVQELAGSSVHPVFLLDEAHLLHPDVLGHLHILLNYEWDSRALLSIVLIGLPELRDRFSLSCFRPLYSRLHARLAVDAVSEADTTEYVRFRLRRAGCERDIFAPDALSLLHEVSGGVYRDIDRIASLAMRAAAKTKQKLVSRDHVAVAAKTGA